MKNTATIISAILLFAVKSNAQITLTSTDFAEVGDTVYMGRDTLVAGVSIGNTGGGNAWNFATLTAHRSDTIAFVDPQTLPDFSSFPAANIAFEQQGGFVFGEKTAQHIKALGFSGDPGGGFPVVAVLNPPQTILSFPVNYQDQLTDTVFFDFKTSNLPSQIAAYYDSVRVKRRTIAIHDFDAHGSLVSPLGTFAQTLREYEITHTVDSIWGYSANGSFLPPIPQGWAFISNTLMSFVGMSNPAIDSSALYRWYVPNKKYTLVEVLLNDNGTPKSSRFMHDPALSAMSNLIKETTGLIVYPNPASDRIAFRRSDSGIKQVEVFTMNGSLKHVYPFNENGEIVLDLKDFNQGMYFYSCRNSDNTSCISGKFSVVK